VCELAIVAINWHVVLLVLLVNKACITLGTFKSNHAVLVALEIITLVFFRQKPHAVIFIIVPNKVLIPGVRFGTTGRARYFFTTMVTAWMRELAIITIDRISTLVSANRTGLALVMILDAVFLTFKIFSFMLFH
jgi:hypothetical protein